MSRISVSQILKRSRWTRTFIDRFLGEPDAHMDNPKDSKWPPMRLYDLSRVNAVEGSREFDAATIERYLRRRAKGLSPGMTRRRNL